MNTEFLFLTDTLGKIFSSTYLEKLARETGFIQREKKLKAKDFISLCTFLNNQSGQKSLIQLCSTLDSNRNVNLCSEGLNQRFNDSAVTFLKRIFTDNLTKKLLDHSGFSHKFRHYFNRIRILDSTGFGLPESCSDHYKGPTGAGLKAQLEYDLVSGEFMAVKIQEILFKTWKSLYSIQRVKKMKPERFECHLYGTLLTLLISSMIVFQLRFILYQKKKKEASEYKGMGIVKEYLVKLQYAVFDQPSMIVKVIETIYKMIAKNGKKSHRYKKLTVFDILGLSYEKNSQKSA